MRKICSLILAVALLLSAVYVIPFTAAAQTDRKYYTHITFDEAYYENGAGTTYTTGMNIVDFSESEAWADSARGKALQFTEIANWYTPAEKYAQGFKFADYAGTAGMILEAGVTYSITYDIKASSSTDAYNKYINLVYGDVDSLPSDANPGIYIHDAAGVQKGWETKTFTVTPETDMNALDISSTAIKTEQTVYVDNIIITTAVDITYIGGADATGLPATAQTGTTYETLLGDAAGNWYLDEGCTNAAEGIIIEPVTLYSKPKDTACYYTYITFDEAYYTEGAGTTYTQGMNIVNNYDSSTWEDKARGNSIQFTELADWYNPATQYAQGFKFADYNGTDGMVLKAGVTYTITYDMKAASSDNAYNKYINIVSGDVQSLPANAVPGEYKGDVTGAVWNWTTKTISITPTVDLNAFSISSGSICTNQNILIDNIIISTTANITYVGGKASGLPATVQTGTAFAELLGDTADDWYLDADYTTPATGVITDIAVTLYAKPSYGTETPRSAGLFVAGKDESTNAGIEGTSGSAVYEIGGVKYAAFRVFGIYVAPAKTDGEGADYGKIVVDANGTTKDIVSRHVMLGYKAEPTLDNNYAMSSVSATFENCWSTVKNADGTYTVTYSLLLKNIPEQYKGTTFYANSAIVTADATYTGEALSGVSAQAVYDAAKDSTIGWFE